MNFFVAHDVSEYKDENGETPELLLVDGNRSAGKTTAFNRKMVDDFKNEHKKFMLIFRYRNELNNVSETFFSDIKNLFFPDDTMTEKNKVEGLFKELYLNGEPCGYAVPLNLAYKLKRYSHVFNDVQQMLFDEYQSETGYCPDEVNKFFSLHKTVARGNGQPVRFVPVYMCSNSVSIFNPYYSALGISSKVRSNTKILRGDGFVLNRVVMKDIANAQRDTAFNRAFSALSIISSSIDNTFLNDDTFNVCKMDTKSMYPAFVFRCEEKLYTVYLNGLQTCYVKSGGQKDSTPRYGVNLTDRADNFLPFSTCPMKHQYIFMYESACAFFQNPICKDAFLRLILS